MRLILLFAALLLPLQAQKLPGTGNFQTDLTKRSIELTELLSGGPPKDGIPALRSPKFVPLLHAKGWLDSDEPVQLVVSGGEVRAYPLQILIWHELVNDTIGGRSILVSFCPLCNAAVVFDRRVGDQTLDFGVSGMLRHSDMVMFDRQTDSLWQQLSGEAIVGSYTGQRLAVVSSQVVPFGEVERHYPNAKVLSRETGYQREYGRNPYAGYEQTGRTLFPVSYKKSSAIRPFERILTFEQDGESLGYLLTEWNKLRIRQDKNNQHVVLFEPTMVTALGARSIADSQSVGSVGVFSPRLDGEALTFAVKDGEFVDVQSGSNWNLFGVAVSGPHEGRRLKPITHGVFYAFAWLAFNPATKIIR